MSILERVIKSLPLPFFLAVVIINQIYAPCELCRIIIICTFRHTVIDHSGLSTWPYVCEVVFIVVTQLLSWILIYLRVRKEY